MMSTTYGETIAVIDDDESIRRAMVRTLSGAGLKVLTFSSARDFLDASPVQSVSCVVSDLRMPDVDGLHLQSELAQRMSNVAMVFVTGHADVLSSVKAMKLGAVDFLEKPVKRAELLDAISRATRRTHSAEASAAELRELGQRYEELTPRERQVLALVAAGLLNKQIAAELGAAEKTVKQHRGVVMDKMRADSLAELVLMADRLAIRPSNVNFSVARGLRAASN
jgi:FixJ family two-component response regulator